MRCMHVTLLFYIILNVYLCAQTSISKSRARGIKLEGKIEGDNISNTEDSRSSGVKIFSKSRNEDFKPIPLRLTNDEFLEFFKRKMIKERFSDYLSVEHNIDRGFYLVNRKGKIPRDVTLIKVPFKYAISACKSNST